MGLKSKFLWDTVGSVASSIRVQAEPVPGAASAVRLLPLPAVLQLKPNDAAELAGLILDGLGGYPDADALRMLALSRFCRACGSRSLPCACTKDE